MARCACQEGRNHPTPPRCMPVPCSSCAYLYPGLARCPSSSTLMAPTPSGTTRMSHTVPSRHAHPVPTLRACNQPPRRQSWSPTAPTLATTSPSAATARLSWRPTTPPQPCTCTRGTTSASGLTWCRYGALMRLWARVRCRTGTLQQPVYGTCVSYGEKGCSSVTALHGQEQGRGGLARGSGTRPRARNPPEHRHYAKFVVGLEARPRFVASPTTGHCRGCNHSTHTCCYFLNVPYAAPSTAPVTLPSSDH